MMAMIDVKFTYMNRKTNSVAGGVRAFRCKKDAGFHGISDVLTKRLKRIKRAWLAKHLPGECASDWSVLGFQEFSDYQRRKERAESLNQ